MEHFCFECITCIDQGLLDHCRYCITEVVQDCPTSSQWKVEYCVTYSLPTCLKVQSQRSLWWPYRKKYIQNFLDYMGRFWPSQIYSVQNTSTLKTFDLWQLDRVCRRIYISTTTDISVISMNICNHVHVYQYLSLVEVVDTVLLVVLHDSESSLTWTWVLVRKFISVLMMDSRLL